ncbi:hypothetical protein IAQ61_003180 [Plenodomus lingam]|uniref:uncharacterized protein n=1 Tax=Leptosphaeria maculans TaxID=5022 RepID=UPI0033233C10|nr:hypothetical protein IAQ61_003180 [Plenodomus lingam]
MSAQCVEQGMKNLNFVTLQPEKAPKPLLHTSPLSTMSQLHALEVPGFLQRATGSWTSIGSHIDLFHSAATRPSERAGEHHATHAPAQRH